MRDTTRTLYTRSLCAARAPSAVNEGETEQAVVVLNFDMYSGGQRRQGLLGRTAGATMAVPHSAGRSLYVFDITEGIACILHALPIPMRSHISASSFPVANPLLMPVGKARPL